MSSHLGYLLHLTFNIAFIFDLNIYLFLYIKSKFRTVFIYLCQLLIVQFRALDQLCQSSS